MRENLEVKCSRFVIWKGASPDDCSLEDRQWLAELLKSLDVESLQDLNGTYPSEMAERADRFGQILSTSDLGRLVRVSLPRTVSQQSSNLSALLLSQSVAILDLSVRSAHCLERAGVTTIGELTRWSTEKLLALKNMGRKSAMEIKAELEELLLRNPDESQPQTSVRPQALEISGGDFDGLFKSFEARASMYEAVLDKPLEATRWAMGQTFATLCGLDNDSSVVVAGTGEFVAAVNRVGDLCTHYKIALTPDMVGFVNSGRVRWFRRFGWPFK